MIGIVLLFRKVLSKLLRNKEIVYNYYRKRGSIIGKNCLICSEIPMNEPYLIKIGDNVNISTNVKFITHDYSIHNVINKGTLYGKITIGDNCFIGAGSILLYGISIANNVIVAAGSVVTKSIQRQNVVVGGNPARIIGEWNALSEKYKEKAICHGSSFKNRKKAILANVDKLVEK